MALPRARYDAVDFRALSPLAPPPGAVVCEGAFQPPRWVQHDEPVLDERESDMVVFDGVRCRLKPTTVAYIYADGSHDELQVPSNGRVPRPRRLAEPARPRYQIEVQQADIGVGRTLYLPTLDAQQEQSYVQTRLVPVRPGVPVRVATRVRMPALVSAATAALKPETMLVVRSPHAGSLVLVDSGQASNAMEPEFGSELLDFGPLSPHPEVVAVTDVMRVVRPVERDWQHDYGKLRVQRLYVRYTYKAGIEVTLPYPKADFLAPIVMAEVAEPEPEQTTDPRADLARLPPSASAVPALVRRLIRENSGEPKPDLLRPLPPPLLRVLAGRAGAGLALMVVVLAVWAGGRRAVGRRGRLRA